jgi:BlaI family penicillinase repressor
LKTPEISEAEWAVMRALWEHGASTASQVIQRLADITNWKPKTIKTLLGRLVNKGALGYQKELDSRGYVYHSLVSEADCVRAES